MISQFILWTALFVLLYAWILYPVLLVIWDRLVRGRDRAPCHAAAAAAPTVGILISAHNEEKVILARLENLDQLFYPSDRIRVYLGVDGSDDRTADIAREYARQHPRVRVHVVDQRRGKMAMLRDLARQSEEELLVFTDANTVFDVNALSALTAPFSRVEVGGVCGRLTFRDGVGRETAEGEYWAWENRLKAAESRVDSCLGANGAIYAIRRNLFPDGVPANTIIDDFVIAMKVREQGYRVIYDPAAIAHEDLPETIGHEWRRRVRIGAGDFQALWLCRRCLLPRCGAFSWFFLSHKVLRWISPHLLLVFTALGMWVLAHTLRDVPAGGVSLRVWFRCGPGIAGLLVLLGAGTGYLLRGVRSGAVRPLQACAYFVAMQAALFSGFLRFCSGDLSGAWKRTER